VNTVAKDRALETTFPERLSQARAVIAVYWLLVIGGLVSFTATILFYEGASDVPEVTACVIGAVLGVLVGQVFALCRLRPWVSWAFFGVSIAGMISLGLFGAAAPGSEVFLLFWFCFTNAIIAGHTSLSHRFGLAAAWLPILFWVASIIIILNEHGRVVAWERNKVSAWLPVPLVILFLTVLLLIGYLATKESHRLTLWQLVGSAPWRRTRLRRAVPRVRMRARGWVALLLLALLVFAGTAVLSPYLWRTGEADDGGGAGAEPTPQDPWNPPGGFDWQEVVEAVERIGRGARDAGRALLPFIPLFLLNRPVRRLWLLWRLRRPAWPEPPSRRIACLWEYVRIGLGDAGLAPRSSDSVEDAVERAAEAARRRGEKPSEALSSAGGIYTRVRYGLGIRPGEVAALDAAAGRAFRDVRSGLTAWERFKSWFRKLD
jgi:hypothetical protein